MGIKAIETSYAGCRFRSRLEARWAVFFDRMGVSWEYEPQGYELDWRLSFCPEEGGCSNRVTRTWGENDQYQEAVCGDVIRYLPDFWLPDLELFCEVKGSLSESELLRLVNAVAAMGRNCQQADGSNRDFLILGPIPTHADLVPWRTHMHKGTLMLSPWLGEGAGPGGHLCSGGSNFVYDVGGVWGDISEIADYSEWKDPALAAKSLLAGGLALSKYSKKSSFSAAYRAARSARFEHGESGANF